MSVSPSLIEQVRRELREAPFKHKGVIAVRWAALLKTTVQGVYRLAELNGRAREGVSVRPELQDWTLVVFTIKKRPPDEAGEISTDQAVKIAVAEGRIPKEALDVPVGTFDRIARENGFAKKERRVSRFQAARPNMAHHVDASSSKFFYVAKRLPGDDYLLKIHRPSKEYKNKPVPCDKLRPWVYGLTDDHSGRFVCRYTAAPGESMADSMLFLAHAWSQIGVPEKLLADQGHLKKGLASQDLIERLDVELPQMMPYAKEAHGKIERPWRTLWQRFEKPFYAGDWKHFEITVSELNRRLEIFLSEDYNLLPHRFETGITRMDAWLKINKQGGVIAMPEDALATAAKRKKRKVDTAGLLSYEGKTFEVKGLHAEWVYVYEGIFEDRLVVQDIKTGNRYEVKDFKPLELDEYRAYPATPHQEIVKEAGTAHVSSASLLYQERQGIAKPGLYKIKETREIVDPFDVTVFADMDAAMKEVYDIAGYLKPGERRWVEEEITKIGLKKDAVIDLALDLRAALEGSRAVG